MLLKSKKSFLKFKVNLLFQSYLVIIVVKLIKIMQKNTDLMSSSLSKV